MKGDEAMAAQTTQTNRQVTPAEKQGLSSSMPHVVIIGAGFGGLKAAKELGKAPVHLTVIDRDNYHLFQPMLYQVATAGLSPDDISMSIRQILRKQRNTEVCLAEVTDIDMQGQKVITADKSIPFDYLIVATGATSNYFGHEDWQQYAPGLKTLDDGMKLRDKFLLAFEEAEKETDPEKRKTLLTFVLVGGGPTGVELAGALADLSHESLSGNFRNIRPSSARIILVEGESRIMPTFPVSLTRKASQHLKSMGVEIRTGVHVKAVDDNSVMIGDEHVSTKNVIWTAGVKASPAGKWLNAEVDHDGRVKVQRDLTIPGHPNIFVIGDTAIVTQKGKHLPGLAPVAMQEASYVAAYIMDRIAGKEHSRPFYYFNKGTLATVGRSFAVVDIGIIRFTGLLAWFTWLLVHLLFLIGFRNRLLVLLQYAWVYFTFQKGSRVILPAYIKSISNVTSNVS